jgi:hypothetical protein
MREVLLVEDDVDTLELFTDRPYVPALMAFFNQRTKRA